MEDCVHASVFSLVLSCLSVQEFCVVSHFPCLEREMAASWRPTALSRPSAATLVSRMQRPHFLCQHDVVSRDLSLGHVTCLAVALDVSAMTFVTL